jgi:hypothetical protein
VRPLRAGTLALRQLGADGAGRAAVREDPDRRRAEVDAHAESDGEPAAGPSLRLPRPSGRTGSDRHANALAWSEVGAAEHEWPFPHDAEGRSLCSRRRSGNRDDEKGKSDRACSHRKRIAIKT